MSRQRQAKQQQPSQPEAPAARAAGARQTVLPFSVAAKVQASTGSGNLLCDAVFNTDKVNSPKEAAFKLAVAVSELSAAQTKLVPVARMTVPDGLVNLQKKVTTCSLCMNRHSALILQSW